MMSARTSAPDQIFGATEASAVYLLLIGALWAFYDLAPSILEITFAKDIWALSSAIAYRAAICAIPVALIVGVIVLWRRSHVTLGRILITIPCIVLSVLAIQGIFTVLDQRAHGPAPDYTVYAVLGTLTILADTAAWHLFRWSVHEPEII